MKDPGSLNDDLINGSWVSKRKRRKIPFGADQNNSNKSNSVSLVSHIDTSPKGMLLNESSDNSNTKKKGNDGYYYECVICDLGGNLLCCDSCPGTYHLQCLDPPLKRIPNGKWHCPSCCQKRSSIEVMENPSLITKRARTKIVFRKSKSGMQSVKMDTLSRFFGSSVSGENESLGKGSSPSSSLVPDVSCGVNPGYRSAEAFPGDDLSLPNVDNGKPSELPLSPTEASEETKSISPAKLSLTRVSELKTDDGTSDRMPGTSCSNGSEGYNDVSMLDISMKKAKKRKQKVSFKIIQKKSRTDRGKHTAKTSKNLGLKEHLTCCQISSTKRKFKAVDSGTSAALSRNGVDIEIVDAHEKDEVDRLLGCRVQGDQTDMNCNTPASGDRMPLKSLDVLESQNGLPEENSCSITTSDPVEFGNSREIVGDDDGINITRDKSTRRRSVVEDSKERTANLDNLCKAAEDILLGEKPDVPSGVSNFEVSKDRDMIAPPEFSEMNGDDIERIPNSAHERKTTQSILVGTLSSKGEAVSYEFLVKWVGKSHIHNSWVTESRLKVIAKRKLDNYKAKYGTAVINLCEEQWKRPQRVIALRLSSDGITEAFVKWTGLPYDECTWERMDEQRIENFPQLINLFHQFQHKAYENDGANDDAPSGKGHSKQTDAVTLTQQPKELRGGSLFPHQLEALNWLRKCWCRSKNVILADEMGLGKTVSAIAFLSSLYFEFGARLPSLVLVPLSTMPNWMAEFSLWAPNLNVVEYHGCVKARNLIRQYEWHANDLNSPNKKTTTYKFNVLLTTYEMVLADSSHLRGVPWDVLVVDEGHRLKNSSSKLFSLLNMFSFQHRLLLTGTPLQNNLGEMYNLLNFLQPKSFPSLSSFEEKFNDLTTAEKVDELKKLVSPHMLRRLKKDAMQNIPPKTERMVPVELSSIQAEYYRAMLTKNYQILRNVGKGVAQQSMLNIVMQLRKVCNHPYLIPGTEPESGSLEFLHDMRIKASAKLTLLHSMLKVLHKEGHRVLIFSQMTKLLDILEDYLNIEFGPKTFERVDGSVSIADRQAAIARFNQDKSRFVFLLSTRSCGLGINLATADTVIIYDSDFNPHADIQAMNRAHRIGQSKRLLVYRLVVRASVEERILQLAKKKLMLDQLFVNKSGSQKEVEDIIRWGTEELFNDSGAVAGKDLGENQSNKTELFVDGENKPRRRTGGLGDVYQDKCTDGNTKFVWDEVAIQKLLDRSSLQSALPDNGEGDLDNDMLGAVKADEWNDDPLEEPEATASLPAAADDSSAHISDKKEDTFCGAAEENEWDRLLRVRWEKYQSEEEATLGRGKRLRKAVSYREAYVPQPSTTLSEGVVNEQSAPEPEPEREYTPAGRALKAKFANLRARQKERLARGSTMKCGPGHYLLPPSSAQDGNQLSRPNEVSQDGTKVIDMETGHDQALENSKGKIHAKQKVSSQTLDFPINHFGHQSMDNILPNHLLPGTSYTNTLPNNNLLPVLGLCAPNAKQKESSQRNISRSYSRQNRQRMSLEFPFRISPCTAEIDAKGCLPPFGKTELPDVVSENLQNALTVNMSDNDLLNMHNLAAPKGKDVVFERSRDFHGKLALPKLGFEESLFPKLPYPATNISRPQSDLFPSLTLGSTVGVSNESIKEFPVMPFFPNLKHPEESTEYNNQEPMLSLSHLPSFSSFPESHRKVLENIMMRTGSGSSNLLKRKLVKDVWTEDELDALWIGVRRHGRGNWESMLRDPRLKFSKFKTAEELSARWESEQLMLLDAASQKPLKSTKSGKSLLFPTIPDGMMKRALNRSRFAGPLNFQPHLTDMTLGLNDLKSSRPAPDQVGLYCECFPPSIVAFPGESSERLGSSSDVHMHQPFLLNSFGASNLSSFGLSGLSNLELPKKDDEHSADMSLKSAGYLDKSGNVLQGSHSNFLRGESSSFPPLGVSTNEGNFASLKGYEVPDQRTSQETKLPHWLRQAVSVTDILPQPDLPPTVSAIAQSVRLLYGDESPTIPPFTSPGPPPSLPMDPRPNLKKKKKHRSRVTLPDCEQLDVAVTTGQLQASSSSPPLIPNPAAGSSELASTESDLHITDVNVNTKNLSSSSTQSIPEKSKSAPVLSPPSEMIQLLESRSSILENDASLENSSDQGRALDLKEDPPGSSGIKTSPEEVKSGDSVKTHSNPARPDASDVKEGSSEGTASDHHEIDHES